MQKSAVLFEGNALPIWVHDVNSQRFLEVNESALQQYGYTREEFLSLTVTDLRHSSEVEPRVQVPFSGLVADPDKSCAHKRKDGTKIYVRMRANDAFFRGHKCRFVVAEDVTERRHLHQQLFQLAHHDALTGLPNRMLLEQRITQYFTAAKEHGHRAAILCLDLDRFKQINDWYGHTVGDECLRQLATMLTRRLRGMDTVARTGGEEFTILLGEVGSVASAEMVAKSLLQALSSPIEIEGSEILLSASFGVAVYPDHGIEASALLRSADAAMYRAKRAGGNRHVLAASGRSTAFSESLDVDTNMRSMLQKGEFELHYQLQYDFGKNIRGMEALLRIPDSKQGFVGPDRFITIAEDTGLIHPLGKWVLEEACRQLKRWNSQRSTPVCVAINVSPSQIIQPEFVNEVQSALSNSGIDPAWLEMEITERVVLNTHEIAQRMAELAQMGIRFAIDDFGTGYSSLQHLHRLPISSLKIDCSFHPAAL